MSERVVSMEDIEAFKQHMIEEEKSNSTIEKYVRDIVKFFNYLNEDKEIDKNVVVMYKQYLNESYKVSSINSMLVALNAFLSFVDLNELRIKIHRVQKKMFSDAHKELTKQEYQRLLEVAKQKENDRLCLLVQTICGTGIRVSEHKYITVEALKKGNVVVDNKGKIREIYFPKKLKKCLLKYCKEHQILSGSVFITKHGKALDRSNIWKMMKQLCRDANVPQEKVFPHNLRHLFAFTYYQLEKDLVKLAGILGHSSIETTRIYAMTTGLACAKTLARMGLVNYT